MGKRGGSSGFTSGQGGNATAPAEKKESLAEYKGKVDRLINGAQGAGGFSQQKEREFKAFLGEQPVGTKWAVTKLMTDGETTVTYLIEKTAETDRGSRTEWERKHEPETGTWVIHEHWSEGLNGRPYANSSIPMSGTMLARELHTNLYDEGGEFTPRARPTTGPPFKSKK